MNLGWYFAVLLRNGFTPRPVIGFVIVFCLKLFSQRLWFATAVTVFILVRLRVGNGIKHSAFTINSSQFNILKRSSRPVSNLVCARFTSRLWKYN